MNLKAWDEDSIRSATWTRSIGWVIFWITMDKLSD